MSRKSAKSKSPQEIASQDRAEAFAEQLGLEFNDLDLLRTALTHRSVVHDPSAKDPGLPPLPQRESNERLEFLGDAILGYIAADVLYQAFPNEPEGVLTARRVQFVRAEQLVRWAREIDLQDYLYLGQGEKVSGGPRDRMLAGGFEALVGAITLDQGLDAARSFLRKYGNRDAPQILSEIHAANPKGTLQEVLQERHRTAPVYETINTEGPAHERWFTVQVKINDEVLAEGEGASKREAEQAAAAAALTALSQADAKTSPEAIEESAAASG